MRWQKFQKKESSIFSLYFSQTRPRLYNKKYAKVSLDFPRQLVREWRNDGQKREALVLRNAANEDFEDTL